MRESGITLLICCLLFTVLPFDLCRAQSVDEKRARVESNLLPNHVIAGERPYTLAERMEHYGVPGVSIAVIEDFEVKWVAYYGVADAGTSEPVTETTTFCVGSVTKAVTAAAALSMVADGLIDLDRDINEQLTGWQIPDNEFTHEEKATPRRLLNHTGGFIFSPGQVYAADAFPTALQILNGERPATTRPAVVDVVPGTTFQYSNSGFTAMRLLMEEKSGKPFAECVAERVLEPLGMKHSTLDVPPPSGVLPGGASGHNTNGALYPDRVQWVGHTAAGGLYTTAADYAAFIVELQKSFHGRSNRILPQELVGQMISPQEASNYGLGVFLYDFNGSAPYFGHIGDGRGFVAGYTSHRTDGYGAVVLTNGHAGINLVREVFRSIATVYGWPGYVRPTREALVLDDDALDALAGRYRVGCDEVVTIKRDGDELVVEGAALPAYRLFAVAADTLVCLERGGELTVVRGDDGTAIALLNGLSDEIGRIPAEAREGAKMAAGEMAPLEMLLAGDADGAVAAYEAWRELHPDDPQVSPRRFNSTGYRCLQAGRVDDAVAVFRVATELFPNDANAYDSLGEGLAAQGNTEEAVASYRRSLELDPRNVNAERMLRKLEAPTAGAEAAELERAPLEIDRARVARDIDSLMDEYTRIDEFSGTMVVADREGVIIEKAYGLANREWDIPNALDTRFRIGSLSKQFTAALVMHLVDESRLDLDARLSDVLDWYRKDTGEQVTIRQLLNHTSGIDRSGVPQMINEEGRTGMPLKDAVMTYCSGDLESEPGALFAYNNAGYIVLSAVVEEVFGAPYEDILRDIITGPVGLADTGMDDSRRIMERRADGYDRGADGLRKPEYVAATLASGAGGLYSTVGDLYLWDRSLYTDAVLSEEAREQMFTPSVGPYGFGWFVTDMPVGPGGESRKVIRHPGQGDGFYSLVWRVPEDGVCVVLINNLGMTDVGGIAQGVLDVVYGHAPKVGMSAVMRNAIDTQGVDAAREMYFRLRDAEPSRYDFSEDQLNRLGYGLLRRGSVPEAVATLALNAEVFPESANAQDSLGESLEHAGDIEGAEAAYRAALSLDPEFEHAAERLRELAPQE